MYNFGGWANQYIFMSCSLQNGNKIKREKKRNKMSNVISRSYAIIMLIYDFWIPKKIRSKDL